MRGKLLYFGAWALVAAMAYGVNVLWGANGTYGWAVGVISGVVLYFGLRSE